MFTKVIKRIHLYLTMFLMPWTLLFAVSTMVMNHRNMFTDLGGKFVVEKDQDSPIRFTETQTPQEKAAEILDYLSLDGPFRINNRSPEKIVVLTLNPVTPIRITYTTADNKLLVEKREFKITGLIQRLHFRRGYQAGNLSGLIWGLAVDFFLVSMIFWVLSGLWMWWKIKPARYLGIAFGCTGLLLILFFIINI